MNDDDAWYITGGTGISNSGFRNPKKGKYVFKARGCTNKFEISFWLKYYIIYLIFFCQISVLSEWEVKLLNQIYFLHVLSMLCKIQWSSFLM